MVKLPVRIFIAKKKQRLNNKNAFPTIWLFKIAMENGLFIDDFPIKTTIYRGFSMAMLNNQMVISLSPKSQWFLLGRRPLALLPPLSACSAPLGTPDSRWNIEDSELDTRWYKKGIMSWTYHVSYRCLLVYYWKIDDNLIMFGCNGIWWEGSGKIMG